MMLEDVDPNFKYLALTLLILLPLGAAHNLTVSETSEMEFGMCTTQVSCQGAEVNDLCLGIETRDVSCITPQNATTAQRAEAECGLDAQALCNADPDLSGTEWAEHPNATFRGRSCSAWAEQDGIDLLECEQTFNDISRWN